MQILSGYFLILPVRDEAGVALGPRLLPTLFVISLFVTLIISPVASFVLRHSHSKRRGMQKLYRCISGVILLFAVLYTITESPFTDPTTHKPQLTLSQALVRAAFFLSMSAANLVAVSTLWARSSDIYTAEQASRIFGILGAGGTLGQLCGSLIAGTVSRRIREHAALAAETQHRADGSGNNLTVDVTSMSTLPLMLVSALLFECAARCAWYMKGATRELQMQVGTPSKTPAKHRGGPFASSSLSSAHAAMENGVATTGTTTHIAPLSVTKSGTGFGLTSSGLTRTSSTPTGGVAQYTAAGRSYSGSKSLGLNGGAGIRTTISSINTGSNSTNLSCRSARSVWDQALLGFKMTWRSPYLRHICTFLIFHYISSSCLYFLKSITVARVPSAAHRMGWFAAINSAAAAWILLLQIFATGRALRWLGQPLALAALPITSAIGMAFIYMSPTPFTVGCVDVARKIATYFLERPAREALFTVVTPEEKYGAKVYIDTVLQRVGDVLAAAVFQVLVPVLGFGPAALAVLCVPVCLCWAGVALNLGQRQQKMAAMSL